MIPTQHRQEGLSMAYVRAIAAKTGYSVQFRKEQYKVDGTFHQIRKINDKYEESGYPLDFELKSSVDFTIEGDKVIYDLDVDNHNELVRRAQDPHSTHQILILFCMPHNENDWVNINEEHLILRKCCFWHQLNTEGISLNDRKRRIKIPITQQLSLETLDQLYTKIRDGERQLC